VAGGLPQVTEREVHRALRRDGWKLHRQGANHTIFVHPSKPGTAPVPRHRRLTPDTIRAIIREMGLSVEEFRKLL